MNISNYYNPFFSSTKSSNTSSMYSIFTNATYHKTVAKYAIASYFGDTSSTSKTSNSSSGSIKDNQKTNNASNFLDTYTSKYKALDQSTDKLKSTLDNKDSTTEEKVAATENYVKAYNSTMDFLNDHSAKSTYTLNHLKSSLGSIGSNTNLMSELGISQKSDGTLSLDTKILTKSIEKSPVVAKGKLSALASLTDSYTSIASRKSTVNLLKEQDLLASTSNNSTEFTYANIPALTSNPTFLKNYYYGISSSGLFTDLLI